MKKLTDIILIVIVLGTALWWFFISYLPRKKQERIDSYLDSKTEEIFSAMTVDERVAQVIHITIPGNTMNPAAEKLLRRFKPGGVILFGVNLGSGEQIRQLTNNMQDVMLQAGGLPLFISTDQEGGPVHRVKDPLPDFPSAAALGQTGRADICEAVGFMTSWHLKSLGINVMFAPVLDINNNPENPVINWRSFGSKPETVMSCALPFERGARAGGALPVIKHFPGHGDTNVDSHLGLPIIEKNWQELQSFELQPFAAAIASGAEALMTAHILYPQIDPGMPATLSEKIVTDLLRVELGFGGIVFTDAMEMHAISKNFGKQRPASKAIRAGVDVILLTSHTTYPEKFHKELKDDYTSGVFYSESGDLLERAVKRQIRLKLQRGLLDERLPASQTDTREEFQARRDRQIQQYHNWLKRFPDLATQASEAAIRSLKKGFHRRVLPQVAETEFWISNRQIQERLQAKYAPTRLVFSDGYLTRQGIKYVIADSYGQHELDILDNYARQFPAVQFLVLHYGRPYLKMPVSPNVELLFSFSPGATSLAALVDAPFGSGEIPPADLALQWRQKTK